MAQRNGNPQSKFPMVGPYRRKTDGSQASPESDHTKPASTPIHFLLDILLTLLMVIFVVTADYVTGVKMSFSLFYFLPVAFISWRRGLAFGIAFSLLCILARYFTDDLGGKIYPSFLVLYWNTFVRGGTLLFTGYVISRLHTTIQEAEEAKNNAITASRSKTEFLWSMSHEIRTPLNSILAMAEVLGDTPLREDQAGYLKIFKSEGRNLLLLINDLLDNAKVEEGRFTAEKVPFELPGLLVEVSSETKLQITAKDLEFNLDLAPDLPTHIVGDPLLLRRVLLNLWGNAVKFTSSGGITISALRHPRDPKGLLLFKVVDTGIGISKEQLGKLFVPFAQADVSTRRHYGGTGLGLSLCKRFVELMGGEITVMSEPGKGSAFSFYIRLLPAPVVGTAPEAKPVEPSHEPLLRILLVDDYEANRLVVKAFLKDLPWKIEEALDGAEGVAAFKESDYDLALLDVQMPVMDGYSAARAIRAWEGESGLPRRPIIALSAHAFAEDIRDATAAGFDAHLTKPFTKMNLIETIKRVVGKAGFTSSPEASPPDDPLRDPDIEALLPKFLENLETLITEARDAAEKSDLETVMGVGHKIKGAGGFFGFDSVSELGGSLEAAAREGDIANARTTLLGLASFLKEKTSHGTGSL